MKKKVSFAIVGCGRISYRHIEAIQANHRAELLALCDLNIDRAEERNAKAQVKLYRSYHEMLQQEKIDVVCIMTPSGMHSEHSIEIMEKYGKNVVVEKPMALKLSDARAMIKTAENAGVQLFVVHQNRLNKAIQKIKSAIDEKIFGKIVLGTVRIRWSRGQAYYERDPWRGTWGLDGGVLTNQSIHHIDLLQWMMGEIEAVSGVATTRLVNVEVEDTATAWLKFKSGALGAIEATTAARPINKDLEASISILGENGTVIVEGASVNRLTTWTFDDIDMSEFSEEPPNVYGFGHNHIIDNVVEVLLDGAKPLIPGSDGVKAIEILHAIYSSIEADGQIVLLKNQPVSKRFGVIDGKCKTIADLYRTDVVLGRNNK